MNSKNKNLESEKNKQDNFYTRTPNLTITSRKNSLKLSLNKNNLPEPKGNLSRNRLSEIYIDYIEAYEERVNKYGFFVPVLFFVFSDNDNPKNDPIVFPVEASYCEDGKKLKELMEMIANTFNSSLFPLEIILYGQESSEKRNYVFGAKAIDDSIISSLFSKEKSKKTKVKIIKNKKLDVWVSGKENPFLGKISKEYAIAQSINKLFSINPF